MKQRLSDYFVEEFHTEFAQGYSAASVAKFWGWGWVDLIKHCDKGRGENNLRSEQQMTKVYRLVWKTMRGHPRNIEMIRFCASEFI